MAEHGSDDAPGGRRRAFLRMVQFFGAESRYPAPYVQFAGKPLAALAGAGWGYDGLGYRNARPAGPRGPGESLRVFAVGDSTLVEGTTDADTIPGRLEARLRATHGESARVYNFGAISACLNQMTALVTMRLADLEPDVILVLGGATDIFQPWSFDPRPGIPFDHFVNEAVHGQLFDPGACPAGGADLSYDGLGAAVFTRLDNLRALTLWQSELWEWEVVRHFELSLRRLVRLSRGVDAPVRFALQPALVRKARLADSERAAASEPFLGYLDRQYGRFERVVRECPSPGPGFKAADLSRLFEDEAGAVFTDIVHTAPEGRERVAAALAELVDDAVAARGAGAG